MTQKMKVIGISRGYVTVEVDDRTLKIYGEGFLREFSNDSATYVDYVLYRNSITWDQPFSKETIASSLREEILDVVSAYFKDHSMKTAIE